MNALEFADSNIVVYAVGQDSGIYTSPGQELSFFKKLKA